MAKKEKNQLKKKVNIQFLKFGSMKNENNFGSSVNWLGKQKNVRIG